MNDAGFVSGETNLTTLPPELRAVIYDHLFQNLSIRVTKNGKLDTSFYPLQISAVSRLLRAETLPILRNSTSTSQLSLDCECGRFPEHIRRRLPSEIFRSIRTIKVLNKVLFDELRPTLTTFPNLDRLEFDLHRTEEIPVVFSKLRIPWATPSNEYRLFRCVLHKLQQEQEMPREGLERDYLPENTLYELCCTKPRARRGFKIAASLTIQRVKQRADSVERQCATIDLDLENHVAKYLEAGNIQPVYLAQYN
ncbi:hypothetical protein PMZ80_003643 [Knufia obscura]|uniref:Uncharacterized protein n=2 Tax=Knufia TaxID=430999 RepID=A0AAN8I972_9EURO|nr:hypothetical protein PMZ80_003643 [Knufia obscura]KAK5958444.1 hypothetical protein OHC33_000287 [Knufia fluminis]